MSEQYEEFKRIMHHNLKRLSQTQLIHEVIKAKIAIYELQQAAEKPDMLSSPGIDPPIGELSFLRKRVLEMADEKESMRLELVHLRRYRQRVWDREQEDAS